MNFNDLFFTLLLYRKIKTRQYRFYDCLVAHDMAYIDVNRFIEPTDTITVSYKIGFNDAVNETPVSGKQPTQQYIICARTLYADTNVVMLSPYPLFGSVEPERHVLIDNGGDGNAPYRLDLTDGFDTRVTVSLSPTKTECYIHATESVTSFTASRSLTEGAGRALLKLFAGFIWQDGTFVYNGCTSRIYSCYIQDANEQYTMRLQPAEDLSTGELGMYDAINDKFYPNKNSVGYFTVEEDITYKIVLDVESQIDASLYKVLCTSNVMPYKTSDNKFYLLLKEFREAEYLESTGSQYIDTGIIANVDDNNELRCEMKVHVLGEGDTGILCARTSQKRIYLLHSYLGWCLGYGTFYTSREHFDTTAPHIVSTIFKKGEQRMQVDGYDIMSYNSQENINLNLNLYLFCVNYNGNPQFYSNVRLYYCKIYKNNILVRDFIPVEKNNEGCLYDKVNRTFFYNKGKGKFIIG